MTVRRDAAEEKEKRKERGGGLRN
ncbi:uncharacterized protein G2W53_036609 [Senna tora]|uniref:Uncharacterized protein n=1 Tax=Senna tora TaxID=362788 RepID=A0A834SVG7_9FABA|nr:uncharacterized protein G2W53_036609 [Senna tora]